MNKRAKSSKLRIIDNTHFEYNYKYYEVLGNMTFKDLVAKTAPYSYYRGEHIITLIDLSPLQDKPTEIPQIKVVYMAGQTMYVSEINILINKLFDMEVKKYAYYLDGECRVPLTEDKVIEEDMTLYIGYSNSSAEDVYL